MSDPCPADNRLPRLARDRTARLHRRYGRLANILSQADNWEDSTDAGLVTTVHISGQLIRIELTQRGEALLAAPSG